MAKKPKKSSNSLGTDKNSYLVSAQVQQSLLERVKTIVDNRSDIATRRERFEKVDRAMQLEDDFRKDRNPDHDFYEDHRPPTMLSHVDTAFSFYVNLFAAGDPVFKVVGNAENRDAVMQMQAKVNADIDQYAYITTLCKCIRDGVKYDEMHAVLEWDAVRIPTFDPVSDSSGRAQLSDTTIEGNKLKYVSPYNCIYDESVSHLERHVRGSYTGYLDLLHMTELHSMLSGWIAVGKSVMNVNTVFSETSESADNSRYYKPSIDEEHNTPDDNGMRALWGFDSRLVSPNPKYSEYKEQYEVCTMYMRIIPSMFNIPCTDANSVQIFKIVIVNMQTVVLLERVTNVMQFFPLFSAQMNDENFITLSKSMAELLMPIQNLATEAADCALAMLYKAAGDKGIYDSRVISKTDIESRKPNAKIPAKPSAIGKDLRGAYVALPFDAGASTLIQNLQALLRQDAADITGQNNAARGQFQKGNRTLHEYQDVMSNADSLKYTKALLIENSFFTPIKNMIRNNIMQYMASGNVTVNGVTTQVNPADLRQAAVGFRVADGLKNVERIANTGALGQAIQLLIQNAQAAVQQGYDPFKAIIRYIELLGVDITDIQGAAPNPGAATPANSVAGIQAQPQVPATPQQVAQGQV